MKSVLFFLSLIIISINTYADTVILKSGKTIEGDIITETEDYIKIETSGYPLTYYKDTIEKISRSGENNNDTSLKTQGLKAKQSKKGKGPKQKKFFMTDYNDDIVIAKIPSTWQQVDKTLFPFNSYSDRVLRGFSHKAAYDVGLLLVGEKGRPNKPMSYQQINDYIIEKLGKDNFHKLPRVEYLSGERVINFTVKAMYDGKEIFVSTDVFFRGKKWKVLEIAFESKDYLAYRDALKQMRSSIELR